MSSLFCRFCSHPNPESSKFCNECGSPLNLVPCAQCEAVNNLADARCAACGAPLHESADAEVPEPALEMAVAEVHAAAPGGAVPVAFADRLEHADAHGPDTAWVPRSPGEHPVPSRDFTFTPGPVESETSGPIDSDAPSRPLHAHAARWQPSRVRGALVSLAFVGIVSAVAWTSLNPMKPDASPGKGADVPAAAPTESAVPAASPAPPAQHETRPTQDAQAPTGSTPAAASSDKEPTLAAPAADTNGPASDATAPAGDTAPASEAAAPAVDAARAPDAAGPPRQSAPPGDATVSAPDANARATETNPRDASASTTGTTAPPHTEATSATAAQAPAATESPAGVPGGRETRMAKRSARPRVEPPRAVSADNRTREQAERDAIATQRIIARELGRSQGAGPGGVPPPAVR
jgi:hypothetical protein